ncbi:alpha/beta hydrolase [Opitutaceae bacterium EW11]|nr:alpha/beta hydrolase [Opitutaceae bacterium EW11]
MASVTHQEIEGAGGVRLHAAVAGNSGRLMLFLHGFPEFWRAWENQMAEFSRDHRTVALDLRGYNLSDKPPAVESYAIQNIVADVRHVLRALSPEEPAILVGHDWGGIVGWALAREHPELLHRLVVINAPHPVLFYRELKNNVAQRIASSYAGFFQLHRVPEATLSAFDFAALRKVVFGTSAKPRMFSNELRQAYHDAWSQPHALTSGLNYYRNLRALKWLLREPPPWTIPVPTLALWGDQDPALLRSNLHGLGAFVPRLTVRRHPTATHWIVHEEPDWVNENIREFLEHG